MTKLPNHWKEVALIEILSALETGSRPKGGVSGILDGVPSLGGEHLNYNGGFNFEKIKYVPKAFANKMTRGLIKTGDVLIVKDGATTGKTAYVDKNFPFDLAFVNEHVFICRTIETIESKCVYYYLRSVEGQDRILQNFTGSAQGGINQKFATNTQIPLPSLPEQKRIVAKLDKLFAHLDQPKARLENVPTLLKQFRQAVLTQAVTGNLTEEWREGKEKSMMELSQELHRETLKNRFNYWLNQELKKSNGKYTQDKIEKKYKQPFSAKPGLTLKPDCWVDCTWDEISDWITYGFTRPMPHVEEGIDIITVKHVKNGLIDFKSSDKTTPAAFDGLNEKDKPKQNDILITKDGATLGRSAVVETSKPFCIGQSVAVVMLRSCILERRFLYYVIESKYTQDIIWDVARGMGMPHLSITDFRKIQFGLPSLEEQKEIVRRVEALFAMADKIEASYKALQEKIDQLPQAILSKAFRGELISKGIKTLENADQ